MTACSRATSKATCCAGLSPLPLRRPGRELRQEPTQSTSRRPWSANTPSPSGPRPGTELLCAFGRSRGVGRRDAIDLDDRVRYANAHGRVVRNPGGAEDGLCARDVEGNVRCGAVAPPPAKAGEGAQARADASDISPAVVGEYTLADGRKAVPVFQLIAERYLDPQYAPEAVSEQCGIPADTIARIARELAQAAFDSKLTLPIAWTDAWGREHDEMVGRPVSMHAMRGTRDR